MTATPTPSERAALARAAANAGIPGQGRARGSGEAIARVERERASAEPTQQKKETRMTAESASLPATRNPADLVRPLHAQLTGVLGLESPLRNAVAALDRASALSFNRSNGVTTTHAERAVLARSIAVGERDFDDEAVRAYAEGSRWIASDAGVTPASVLLAEAVRHQANQAAATELMKHATGIFDMLAAEAARVVGIFESLPEPPRNVFGAGGDLPAALLTRAPGHEATYGTILGLNDRFGAITSAANLVRGPAGYGVEHFPDGAPRIAGVYRNWVLALSKDSELRGVHRHLRNWFTVVDGWHPGCWKPDEIATTADDASFLTKLKRFGGAVTGG